MSAPFYMSLPSASEMTVDALGFSRAAVARMRQNGIASALQLAELASLNPRQLRHATGVSGTKAIRLLETGLGALPDFHNVATSHEGVPPSGVPLSHAPPVELPNAGSPVSGDDLDAVLRARIADLPTQVLLTDRMQPVGNQGPHGTCVGWAANATHEYRIGRQMSAGYAYRGAKARDGFSGVGSWLVFAMQHGFDTGHVDEESYPYTAAILDKPIELLGDLARRARTFGHVSLMRKDLVLMPGIMRAVLAGRLNPEIGPLPIAVSLKLYESFVSTSTALDGLIRMPLPGETVRGGHAMCVVGYVTAEDPANPFGIDYFAVRNSWGTRWACHNPFDLPGHAMIPAKYFTSADFLMEAFISLGGQR